MMEANLNLDHYISRLFPWDFTVTIQGAVYPTRPVTVEDLAIIGELEQDPKSPIARLRDLVASFFTEDDPHRLIGGLSPELLLVILRGITDYWKAQAKKNASVLKSETSGTNPDPKT